MSDQDRVSEAVGTAVEMERKGIEFYQSAAQKMTDPFAKAMFLSIAEDEKRHERIFREMGAQAGARPADAETLNREGPIRRVQPGRERFRMGLEVLRLSGGRRGSAAHPLLSESDQCVGKVLIKCETVRTRLASRRGERGRVSVVRFHQFRIRDVSPVPFTQEGGPPVPLEETGEPTGGALRQPLESKSHSGTIESRHVFEQNPRSAQAEDW